MVAILLGAPLIFYTHGYDVFEFNKITAVRICSALAAGLLAFRLMFVRPTRLVRSPLDWPLAVFTLFAVVSTLKTVNLPLSVHGVYEDFEGITTVVNYAFLAWWMQQHVRATRQVHLFMGAVMLAGCAAGFYGVLQNFQIDFVPWNPATYSKNRLFATLGNPNFLAAYLVMSVPVTFMAFLDLPERIRVEKRFCAFLIVLGALASVFLIWLFNISWFDFNPASYGADTAGGMLMTPKFIAAHFVVLFPLAAALLLYWGRLKLVLLVSLLFQLISIYFTKSSGGMLALGVAAVLLVAFFAWEARRGSDVLRRNRYWLAGFAAACLLTLFYPPIRQTLVETVQRFSHRVNPNNIEMTPRLYIWRSAVEMLRDNPVFGTGLDTFQISFPKYRSALYWSLEWNGTPEKAHNFVLQIAATMGFAGLAAFFWLVAAWLGNLWRLLRAEALTSRRMLAFGGFAAVVAFMVQDLFSFTVVGYGSLFWMLLGLTPAMERAWKPAEAEEPATLAPRPVPGLRVAAFVALCVGLFAFAEHSTRIWVADSYYKQGQVGMGVGRWDYAIAVYQKAAGKVRLPDGQSAVGLLKPEPNAVRLEITPGLNEGQELYWVKMGIAYEAAAAAQQSAADREKVYWMALAIHQHTVDSNPVNGYNYNNKGRTLKSMGEQLGRAEFLKAAVLHYQRAIELDPNNVYFNLDLANTWMDLGDWDAAVKVCERLGGLYPDFAMPKAYMGYARMRQGRTDDAMALFAQAVPMDWKGEGAQQSITAANLGMLQLQKGQRDKAVEAFKASVQANPQNADSWLSLARLHGQAGRREEAARAYEALLAVQPQNPEALKALGRSK